ncbi:MAG TPA: esterase-like activity of phytase family protein [Sphingomicrobium sp.]|nr:esterase-like activity of phytase family protein [Sphingomicrobium sp.]
MALSYMPVGLVAAAGPLRLTGAWEVRVADPRFSGISSLTIDQGRFLAVSDRGSVARFERPGAAFPRAWVADLRVGPGPWGRKWARDAESVAADPDGRGWWVGYEQNHSVWLYDRDFNRTLAGIDLDRPDWWNNRGAEGLLADDRGLLVVAENGREVMQVRGSRTVRMPLDASADVAEAARAPDGTAWLLLRTKSLEGISQSIAPMVPTRNGYRAGAAWPLPKGAFDNFEGMAIEPRPGGAWRFWLISDDGHRIMARTLLVALDYVPPVKQDESPASAGLSKKPPGKKL